MSGVTKGTPTKCFDCHWIRRQDDPYETRLGNQCEKCHRPISWTAVNWNHAARTGFALNAQPPGAGVRFVPQGPPLHGRRRSTACSCHLADYQQTSRPEPRGGRLPARTARRATSRRTRPGRRRCSTTAAFPLVGMHATQACAQLPQERRLQGHAARLRRLPPRRLPEDDQPEPRGGRASRRRARRATRPTDAELEGRRLQPRRAAIPLVGTARDAGVRGVPQERRLQGHAARLRRLPPGRLPEDDEPEPRRGRVPDHVRDVPQGDRRRAGQRQRLQPRQRPSRSSALHATQACAACHKNGVYKGTPRDCVGCHLADYQKTTNPNHAAAGFPTTCETCHKPTRRRRGAGGGFNHASGLRARRRPRDAGVRGVPQERRLQGHAARLRRLPPGRLPADDEPEPRGGRVPDDVRTVPQGDRRRAGPAAASITPASSRWSALTRRRRARRATRTASTRARRATASAATWPNYQQTTNPNHAAAGFPTTCETCHKATDTSWTQGRFNHTAFPITSGRHAGVACATCHTTPNNFTGVLLPDRVPRARGHRLAPQSATTATGTTRSPATRAIRPAARAARAHSTEGGGMRMKRTTFALVALLACWPSRHPARAQTRPAWGRVAVVRERIVDDASDGGADELVQRADCQRHVRIGDGRRRQLRLPRGHPPGRLLRGRRIAPTRDVDLRRVRRRPAARTARSAFAAARCG